MGDCLPLLRALHITLIVHGDMSVTCGASVFLAHRYRATARLLSSYVVCLSSVTRLHCGQGAGWIRMPLCTEVDLGPSDIY